MKTSSGRTRQQKLREALLPEAYGRPCIHCGLLMLPGQRLALIADGQGHRAVHLACHAAESARRGAAERKRRAELASVIFPPSTGWSDG